jgi:hypothetical protein
MTEELTPEFLQFSEMLDTDNPTFEEKAREDVEILRELTSALKEEPEGGLPEDFSTHTACQVLDRFEQLPTITKGQRWLESTLLQPVNGPTGLLKFLAPVFAIAGISLWEPRVLWFLGPVLLILSLTWSAHLVVTSNTWGSGSFSLQAAVFRWLNVLVPVVASALLVVKGGWELGGLFSTTVEAKASGAALLLVLTTPILKILTSVITLLHGRRARYTFAITHGLSWAIFAELCRSSFSTRAEFWLFSLLGLAIVAGLTGVYPEQYWSSHDLPIGNLKRGGILLFCSLPILNAVLCGVVVGSMTNYMGYLSFSFRNNQSTLSVLSILLGLGLAFLIVSGTFRYWEAVMAEAGRQPWRVVRFQALHTVVASGLAFLLPFVFSINIHDTPKLAAMGLLFLIFLGSLACAVALSGGGNHQSKLNLREARKRSFQSLAFGLVPIVAATVVFYRINLTTEIHDPHYRQLVAEVEAWQTDLATIPAEQNGWMVMRPYMLKTELENKDNMAVNSELKVLSKYVSREPNDYQALVERGKREVEKFQTDKSIFLAHLPKIKKAIARPYFSHIAVEGSSIDTLVPDFIAARAVNQSLDLLVQEALAKGNSDEAFDYALTGLQWGTKMEPGSLIGLMISIAQLHIAHQHLEEAVVGGAFNDQQLQQLSEALRQAQPATDRFALAMKCDTVMCDGAFDLLLNGEGNWGHLVGSGLSRKLFRFMPESYWESERKAYWNTQLSMAHTWNSLALNGSDEMVEISPFNVASEMLVPNSMKARAQFCYLHSKYTALIVVCQLERYKIHYGEYPHNLEDLVPGYLEKLPEDLMQPAKLGKKGGFHYRLNGEGYLLKSRSSAYRKLTLDDEQVYGHDKNFQERRSY